MEQQEIDQLTALHPIVGKMIRLEETAWFNPRFTSLAEGLPYVGLGQQDIDAAAARLLRFASYFVKAFPETASSGGIIESELAEIPRMQSLLGLHFEKNILGKLWLKKDSHLPISGSIKARGGIYEVLCHAEALASSAGLLNPGDNYAALHDQKFRDFFGRYSIAVGSTGNLGLSIGMVGAKLGFKVTVHMSADARRWKKEKLRENNVVVKEYAEDYGVAVEEGRKAALRDPDCFFIDDENSRKLFVGYSVAGARLKRQLDAKNIPVDAEHPLFVYLPCGVGGGPGGVAFGLKMAFGDHVHCIFAEPTHSPCMLLGVATGLHDAVSVQDVGIDNVTTADGLAVGRASGFVGRAMERLLDGFYTVSDETLYLLLGMLNHAEGIRLEPSALAGMLGPILVNKHTEYAQLHGLTDSQLKNANHIVWATGGGMVPDDEMNKYIEKSKYYQSS